MLLASSIGLTDIVKKLLEHGAYVNYKTNEVDYIILSYYICKIVTFYL